MGSTGAKPITPENNIMASVLPSIGMRLSGLAVRPAWTWKITMKIVNANTEADLGVESVGHSRTLEPVQVLRVKHITALGFAHEVQQLEVYLQQAKERAVSRRWLRSKFATKIKLPNKRLRGTRGSGVRCFKGSGQNGGVAETYQHATKIGVF